MKAIIITENIKVQNELSQSVGSIKTYGSFPTKFWNTERVVGGYQHRTDLHETDGFRDVVQPSYNSATQYKGAIYFDDVNDVFTYQVIDKTDEEIQNELISNSEANKQDLIQTKLANDVVNEAQSGDDTNALDNQDLFPLWDGDAFDYTLDFKCQHFTAENELVLYKCVQAHTSQSGWNPESVPALFTRVAYPNQILDWVQPTGAQDAYQIGDQVYHDNPNDNSNIWLYESKINANTTEPGRDGTFDRWWEPLNVKP